MYILIYIMITKEQRANRLRNHEELKGFLEVKLAVVESESDREHLIARIAEVERNIKATKLPEVALSEPEALLAEITKTPEEDAEKAEDDIVPSPKQTLHKPKSAPTKIKKVGNPF